MFPRQRIKGEQDANKANESSVNRKKLPPRRLLMPTCNQIQINPNAQIRYITNTNTDKWSAQIQYITNTNTDQFVQHSSHWHAPNPHGNRLEMSKLPNWNGSDTTILMQTSSCLPFTWICLGLGPRSITFSCVCVSPSVSITLCVSPVCPSPRVS